MTGMTIAVGAAMSVASNFFVLNSVAVVGVVCSTIFMRDTFLPFVLNRRYAQLGLAIPATTKAALKFGFSVTLLASPFLLLSTNSLVYYIKKCHDQKNEPTDKKPKWMVIDGTDPVTNGMILASSIGLVFAGMFYQILTLPSKLRRKGVLEKERDRKKEEKKSALLNWILG